MQQITNVQRNTAYCMLYRNFFILFLLKQMKFKVVKGFESQVLYEIENNLFAIRLIIDRIPEFQGSYRAATIASAFFWMRGINDVDYISKKWKF